MPSHLGQILRLLSFAAHCAYNSKPLKKKLIFFVLTPAPIVPVRGNACY